MVLLPEGSEVTLAELREIAARQQQQIEAQQQLLVAKEQRLKFLKQQEARHHHGAQTTEGERLRPLRDKVETQELKLRRLRALRGQAEQQRASNHNLTAELDSIRALFNEKEKELSLAVAKVEELTRQLEELRRGNVNGLISENGTGNPNSPSVVELEKLRRELLYRTKLNEQQNARILHQRETLAKRQEEISLMDQRIASLQQRLHRKRTLNQQIASHIHAATLAKQAHQIHPLSTNNSTSNLIDNQGKNPAASRLIRPLNTNIAAVEPLKRVPQENDTSNLEETNVILKGEEEDDLSEFALNKKDPKYQTLPYNTKFSVKNNREGLGDDTVDKCQPYSQLVTEPEIAPAVKTNDELHHQDNPSSISTSFHQFSPQKPQQTPQPPPPPPPSSSTYNSYGGTTNFITSTTTTFSKIPSPHAHNLSNLAPRPFGSSYSASIIAASSNKGQLQQTTNVQGIVASNQNGPSSTSNAQPVPPTSSMVTSPVMGKHPVLSSSQSSNGVVPRSKLPTATGIPVLPATALTSALKKPTSINHGTQGTSYKDIPPYTAPPPGTIRTNNSPVMTISSLDTSPTTGKPTTLPMSSTNHNDNSDSLDSPSDSASSDNSGDKSKPALPPKPSIPVKPVPPPRQTHVLGVASASNTTGGTKKSDVDSALMVLKGTGNRSNTRNGNGYRYVMKPSHNFPSRLPLGPASMDQYTKAVNHVYRHEIQQQNNNNNNNSQSSSDNLENDSGTNSNSSETNDSEGSRKVIGSSQPLPIQPRPLTIKKPSGLDPPRLRSTLSGSGLSSQIKRQGEVTSPTGGQLLSPTGLTNRRIDMPPAFLFPENQNGGGGGVSNESNNQNQLTSLAERLVDTDGDVNGTQLPLSPIRNKSGIKFIKESSSTSGVSDLISKEERINGNQLLESERVLEGLHSNSEQGTEDENDSEHRKHLSETSQDDVETDESGQVSSGKSAHLSGSSAVFRRVKKGNLKTKGSAKNPRRVSFDPLALLLDASLEGELELVKKTAKEVPNPSAANDEGITALHNAICAGHLEIVKFLVEFGCDVNAQDSDGWTPLHCAASCNNLPMVKFLVEHGACIFATTLSDHETAAEKCEEDEEGFDGCSEYLYSVQEKLGILNGGAVFGVYEYEAQNPDELSFKDGEMLIVLRKGDDLEREWWWSKLRDREGYIPRNLLGLHARVSARRDP